MKKDIYTEVTSKIIAALEQNIAPWLQPWDSVGINNIPCNAATTNFYHGINVVLLWMERIASGYSSNQWMTFKQAESMGARVKKGEKGTEIIFYKTLTRSETVTNCDTGHEEDIETAIPMLRTFYIFNTEQIDGVPEKVATIRDNITLPNVEEVIRKTGADIRYGNAQAFYAPASDYIAMPDLQTFKSTGDFYATILHELSHNAASWIMPHQSQYP